MERIAIVSAEEKYCRSYTDTITSVAREGLYLSNNTGFTYEEILAFYKYCKRHNFPQFYAINEKDEVIGWCDIVPRNKLDSKIGYLGVGLRDDYREHGIGPELISRALKAAASNFKEVRLECRASNTRAIHVYENKFGFRHDGYNKKGLVLDGKDIPVVYMRKKLK